MIEQHGVDVLLVQESYAPQEHLPPLLYRGANDQSVWAKAGTNRWGSGIDANTGTITPAVLDQHSGWIVGAELTGFARQPTSAGDSTLVFSLHAPPTSGSYHKSVHAMLDKARGQNSPQGRSGHTELLLFANTDTVSLHDCLVLLFRFRQRQTRFFLMGLYGGGLCVVLAK